ncbi:uncharacterized protein BO80DRAFT_248965 [Aspergillus ibericus CBS 121593]|uniref:Uncharacterized protein n=1 Tax=Aspergillus ibericus CBS 121593 TaxID=1448316 RepID=A0A395GLU5_9EURO|nr:hypothetical protein BO80DRAFT_248965 [Aspergillus ibericus CBS 121593]RAK95797.1 hypothetical protein BO80DRAFT_248965 [Aspergillus ibericus CBS 121593]
MAPKTLLFYAKRNGSYWLSNFPGLPVADASPLVDLTDKELTFESELLLAISSTMEGNPLLKRHNYFASYKMCGTVYVLLEKRDTLFPLTPLSSCGSTLGVRSVDSNEGLRRARPTSESIVGSEEGQDADWMSSGRSSPAGVTRNEGHASSVDGNMQVGWQNLGRIVHRNGRFPRVKSGWSAPRHTKLPSVVRWDKLTDDDGIIKPSNSEGHASVALSEDKRISHLQAAKYDHHALVIDSSKDKATSSNEQAAEKGRHMATHPLIVGQDIQTNKSDTEDNASIKSTLARNGSASSGSTFAAKLADATDALKEKMPSLTRTPYPPLSGFDTSLLQRLPSPYGNLYLSPPTSSYPHNPSYPSTSRYGAVSAPLDDGLSCCPPHALAYNAYPRGDYMSPAYRQPVDHIAKHCPSSSGPAPTSPAASIPPVASVPAEAPAPAPDSTTAPTPTVDSKPAYDGPDW